MLFNNMYSTTSGMYGKGDAKVIPKKDRDLASSPTSPHPPAWMVKKMKENEWKRANNQLGSFFSSYSPLPDPFKRGNGRRQGSQLSASVDASSKGSLRGGLLSHRDHVPESPFYRQPIPPIGAAVPPPEPREPHSPPRRESPPPQDTEFSLNLDQEYSGNPVMRTSIGYNNMVRQSGSHQDPHGFKYSSDRAVENPPSTGPAQSAAQFDPRYGYGGHSGLAASSNGKKGGALLFIRFPIGQGDTSNIIPAAQAFLRAKIHDVGGVFLGIAKKTFDFGYDNNSSEAIGVFHFPTMDKAVLFFQLDPVIRQPDFPPPYGHSQMWIVCNAYLPDNMDLFNTFLLSEVSLHKGKTKREFFENFQVDFEKYLAKNGVMPFVVCSYGNQDRCSLRRHAYPASSIVTCHLFQGLEHLQKLSREETYCKFRSLHNQMAVEKCSIFTLHKRVN